jgi:hypothetical protein
MAIFYGLYVEDERLAAALDLMRFLAEPKFVRRAHITVRGPYDQRQDHLRGNLKKYTIAFLDIDSFIKVNSKQNTVFLKCEIPTIEEVWHKPDYTGAIRPHVTIYDGLDRSQAYAFLHCCQRYSWNFLTTSGAIVEIKPKSQAAAIEEFDVHQNVYDEILGRRIDYRSIQEKHWRERLPYFEEVARFIEANFVRH